MGKSDRFYLSIGGARSTIRSWGVSVPFIRFAGSVRAMRVRFKSSGSMDDAWGDLAGRVRLALGRYGPAIRSVVLDHSSDPETAGHRATVRIDLTDAGDPLVVSEVGPAPDEAFRRCLARAVRALDLERDCLRLGGPRPSRSRGLGGAAS